MAKNIFKPLAFIDNSQIKITDEDGEEYISCIQQRLGRVNYYRQFLKVAMCLILFFGLVLCSQPFIHFFSVSQLGIFTGGLIGSFFLCLIVATSKSECTSNYELAVSEYNRAKHVLQPRIMELEAELVAHKARLQGIEKSHKFNFKEMEI